jgi:hypothetical protein
MGPSSRRRTDRASATVGVLSTSRAGDDERMELRQPDDQVIAVKVIAR